MMRTAIYARVSTPRQARAQNIDDQVERLKAYVEQKGFGLEEEHIYLDEGYSGANLNRPGLDALRDAVAMAEYELPLITERMRRGRLAKLRAGQLLPWMRVPFGYRTDPERPRDPLGLRVEGYEAAIVGQMFAWYLQREAPLGSAARLLMEGR